ncbi:class I SAM-dependent methyltransferase [Gracilibacillus salinarum]|uniref:Methyltransferase domain-containing protein n=1 Tax=Gracilibacillus salinarum TaxID=2932255 RepID=A0ABY4GGY5_9BACI|nr:class I SAM-dependent methyltransferase [Gracilibacillus salinarum]UOQ83433.1 methyltransferase domain-containing protein [Gracilibacillus salinarum]
MKINSSYQFDRFKPERMQSEGRRLTKNVESHSQTLMQLFLEKGLYEAQKVLDVGCGTGAMIDLFSNVLTDKIYYGVDNSSEILDIAKKQHERKEERVTFVQSNANHLPFSDNSFDFVYTRLVLMHNSNPNDIIREMIRVCKPGGVICAVEIDDGTQVFHPYGEELSKLINANIMYAHLNGTDRTIGRKLYSFFVNENSVSDVNIIIQTSDYSNKNRKNEEMPILLKFALGEDEGKRFVEQGLLTENERMELVSTFIPEFCSDPNRFESSSFMYAFGKKVD